MKWQILFLLFFLFPLVTALEYNVGKINDCVTNLNINVTGTLTINENEYSLKDCNLLQSNYWSCSCSNPIILITLKNTINNYTFTITYTIQQVQKEIKHSGGGSSGGGYYYNPNITYNDSIFNNPTPILNTSDITYPFYNITNEYKTVVMNVNPQPLDAPINNVVPVVEVKKSIWQRFWDALLELLRFKLW